MTKKIINIGSSENSGNGDPLRVAFSKINDNFTELYTGGVGNNIDLSAVDQHIIPATDSTYDLGSPDKQWRSLYVSTNTIYIDNTPITISNNTLVVGDINNRVTLATLDDVANIPKGDTGPAGSTGLTGPQGAKGDTGNTGPQGAKGDTGNTGPQGAKGDKGDTGDQGVAGPKGDQGLIGPTGPTGPTGASGADGAAGTPGATGPKGDTGLQGLTGPAGAQGTPGAKGDTGDTGAQGVSVTLQGTKATIADLPAAPVNPSDFAGHGWIVTTGDGNTHLDGALWFWNLTDSAWNDIGQIVGPQGDQGAQGPAGAEGAQGPAGATGPAGSNGADGAAGTPGATGPEGPTGPTGPQGADGAPGLDADPTSLINGAHSVVLGTDGDLTVPNSKFIKTSLGGSFGIRSFTDDPEPATGTVLSGGLYISPQQVSINYGILNEFGDPVGPQWDFHPVSKEFQIPGAITKGNSKLEFNADGGTNVYLTPTTDDSTAVFINTIGVQAYAARSVNLTAGDGLLALELIWTEAEQVFADIRDQDAQISGGSGSTRPWAGLPSYQAYDLISAYVVPNGVLPPASNLMPAANVAKQAYETWQTDVGNTGIVLRAGDKEWTFTPTGELRVPEGAIKGTNGVTIKVDNPSNPLATRDWTFSPTGRLTVPGVITAPDDATLTLVTSGTNDKSASIAIDGEFARTLLRTYDGLTLNTWELTETGNLKLPVGGDITDSAGVSVLGKITGWAVATGNHLVPNTDNLQDIGTPTARVRHIYVGPGSVTIGNSIITESVSGKLVLPGVTRATTLFANEVEDTGDQTRTWSSGPFLLDAYHFGVTSGSITPPQGYSPADYDNEGLDEDGYIDGISVYTPGVWTQTIADYNRTNNMYAYIGTNVQEQPFNPSNWVQIPFHVRAKANDVEYEFGQGGGSITVSEIDAQNEVQNEVTNVTKLRFDSATGFSVTELDDGEVKISLGSSWKTWQVAGEDSLVAVGEDTVTFVAGTNMNIATNAQDKTITFNASGGSVGSGVVFREVVYPLGAVGDTQGTIAVNAAKETFIAVADYDAEAVPTFTVQHSTGGAPADSGRSRLYVDLRDYAELLAYLQEITTSGELSPGEGQVSLNGGSTWFEVTSYTGLSWENNPPYLSVQYIGDQPEDEDEVIIRFPTDVVQVWIKPNMGDLTITSDNITGEADIQITAGDDIRIYANDDISLRTYSTENGGGSVTISTNYNEDTEKTWEFTNDGNLDLPAGGEIRFSYGYIDQDTGTNENALRISGGNGVVIKTDEDGKTWEFDYRGSLRLPPEGSIIFPDNTFQTTAYTGQSGGDTTVARQDTPPSTGNGTLWYNTVEGRLYIKYSDVWVDAAPLVMPAPDTDIDVASITFPDASVQTTAFPTKLVNGVHEVVLGANGTLTVADDIKLPRTGRIIKDCENNSGTTSMRWHRIPTDTEVELIRAYTGNEANPDDVERAKISVEWQTPTQTGLSITAFDDGDEYKWEFKGDGTLTLPGDIVFAGGGYIEDSEAFFVATDGGFQIQTNKTASPKVWEFGDDGITTFPSSSSAFTLGTDFTQTIIGGTSPTEGYIRVESTSGAPNFDQTPISTNFYNFLSTLTAGTKFTVTTVVDGITYITEVAFTQFASGLPASTTRNDLYWTRVSGDTLPFSYSASALTLTFTTNGLVVAPTGITFPDNTVQTTAYTGSAVVQGQYTWTVDGSELTKIPETVTINYNLFYLAPALGYLTGDDYTLNISGVVGSPGQRLVVFRNSTLCNLRVVTNDGNFAVADFVPAEFIYISTVGWAPLYGATVIP